MEFFQKRIAIEGFGVAGLLSFDQCVLQGFHPYLMFLKEAKPRSNNVAG